LLFVKGNLQFVFLTVYKIYVIAILIWIQILPLETLRDAHAGFSVPFLFGMKFC